MFLLFIKHCLFIRSLAFFFAEKIETHKNNLCWINETYLKKITTRLLLLLLFCTREFAKKNSQSSISGWVFEANDTLIFVISTMLFFINILSLNLSKLIKQKIVSQKIMTSVLFFLIISSGLIFLFVWFVFQRVSGVFWFNLILWWFSVKLEKVGIKHGVVIIKWWYKNQIHKQSKNLTLNEVYIDDLVKLIIAIFLEEFCRNIIIIKKHANLIQELYRKTYFKRFPSNNKIKSIARY